LYVALLLEVDNQVDDCKPAEAIQGKVEGSRDSFLAECSPARQVFDDIAESASEKLLSESVCVPVEVDQKDDWESN
jgi:hypothetical protein